MPKDSSLLVCYQTKSQRSEKRDSSAYSRNYRISAARTRFTNIEKCLILCWRIKHTKWLVTSENFRHRLSPLQRFTVKAKSKFRMYGWNKRLQYCMFNTRRRHRSTSNEFVSSLLIDKSLRAQFQLHWSYYHKINVKITCLVFSLH